MQIQLLRSHFDEKMRARKTHASSKAKVYAKCYALLLAQISSKNGKQKSLPYLFAFYYQNANA